MPRRNLAWLLVVPAVVLIGLAIGYSAPPPDKDYQLIRQIVNVLAEVDTNYVRELKDEDRQKLVEDMINGGLRDLDPHSEYLNADKLQQFETASEGSFGGVGVTLAADPKSKFLRVEHPMPGTPAYEAGVAAGDQIVKVGDVSTEGMKVDEARRLITGKIGTPVTLTIRRDGRTPADQEVTVHRARIAIHPVTGVRRRADDPTAWEWMADPEHKIGYIRIESFSEPTAAEVKAAVEQIEAAGGKGIVLDLRDDPGGLLNQAIAVADLFLTDGKIVSTKDRRGTERAFTAEAKGTLFEPAGKKPMAVLVNRNSASASEIVAAALQDHGRAAVVGERTYGKGSVQKLLRLPGEPAAAVKLTTETYWRPSGQNIHRYPNAKETDEWGVKPNPGLEVASTDEDRLRYALHRRDLDFVAGKPGVTPAPKPPAAKADDPKGEKKDDKPYEDKVLQKAIEYLRSKQPA